MAAHHLVVKYLHGGNRAIFQIQYHDSAVESSADMQ